MTQPLPSQPIPTPLSRKPRQIVCSLSGEVPEQPVFSRNSGHIFEKRLIERALLASNNICPETGQPLTPSDLVPVKASGAVVQPVSEPSDGYSVSTALQYAREQWDVVLLELHQAKTALLDTKKELATALYRLENAEHVVAQLQKDNGELKRLNTDLNSKEALAHRVAVEAEAVAHEQAAMRRSLGAGGANEKDADGVDKRGDVQKALAVEGGAEIGEMDTAMSLERHANGKQVVVEGEEKKDTEVGAEELRTFPGSLLEQAMKRCEELQKMRKARIVPAGHASATTVGSFSEVGSVRVDEGEVAVKSIAMMSDGVAFAGTSSGKVVGIDVEKMQKRGAEIVGHESVRGGVCRVRWDVEGMRLLSAGGDGAVKVWDEGRQVALLQHGDAVVDFGMHTVGGIVLVVLEDGRWVWRDLGSSGAVVCEGKGEGVNMSGAIHPDGLVFGTGRGDGIVDLWDARTMKCVASYGEKGAGVRAMEMSEKGYYMVSAAGDEVRLWDLRKGISSGSVKIGGGAFGVQLDNVGEFGCGVGGDSVRLFAGRKKAKVLAEVACGSDGGHREASRLGCGWGTNAEFVIVGDSGGTVRKFGGGVE